ncbi:hypothetical protein SH2C18_18140 [Clostridium sediminicola]|uniref:CsxC family protein n=1 Tax=Clostridium sediminicola TaxID=3114879 RepID=UPI0031F22369
MSRRHKHKSDSKKKNRHPECQVVKIEETTTVDKVINNDKSENDSLGDTIESLSEFDIVDIEANNDISQSEEGANDEVSEDYRVEVYKSSIIKECSNEVIKTKSKKNTNSVVSMLPVLLAVCKVNINLEAIINFFEPVLEISKINKNVILEKYYFMQETNTLFLQGFIRQYVEYASVKSVREKSICGDVAYSMVYIPFECSTDVYLTTKAKQLKRTSSNEENYRNSSTFEENSFSKVYYHSQYFNNNVFCELESAKILELSIKEDKEKLNDFFVDEYTFKKLKEKVVVSLTIKLLQNQEIFIPGD